MILSVSRRTDIPAFFLEWFMGRVREGFVLSRNPMNHAQVSRISLSPEVIDCVVFWTKNPAPLIAAGAGGKNRAGADRLAVRSRGVVADV